MILEKIFSPKDVKKCSLEELYLLCKEIRDFLILDASKNGGHFGSSLGVVEITVALHYVFDLPKDIIVWDVGHQAYVHKLLTGRKENFSNKRKKGGIAPFPHPLESEYDSSVSGHASVSISTALGLDIAAKQQNQNRNIIACIGDGALTGGQSFEALNNAGDSDTDILVILNDNQMSIDPNVGGLQKSLLKISKSKSINHLKWSVKKGIKKFLGGKGVIVEEKISQIKQALKNRIYTDHNFFESLGINYYGPYNGHDLENIIKKLELLKKKKGPKVLHLLTTKGKGFAKAEKNQTQWHATSGFELEEKFSEKKVSSQVKFQEVFGQTLTWLMEQEKNIVGVTPAMPTGCSMTIAQKKFPDRIFDVGIAEPHAITFSAGLAKGGMTVFCNIYSTFLQRAIDQIIHDCCIEKLPVIICIDRAGFVGEDGETHQGAFDIPLLAHIPNISFLAPRNGKELSMMMIWASKQNKGPILIRYPKGNIPEKNFSINKSLDQENFSPLCIESKREAYEKKIAIISVGPVYYQSIKAIKKIEEDFPKHQRKISLYNLRSISPLDTKNISTIISSYQNIITIEEGSISGGVGEKIIAWKEANLADKNYRIHTMGIQKKFIKHATIKQQLQESDLNTTGIYKKIISILNEGK